MEGQSPQIRTMAKDLDRIRREPADKNPQRNITKPTQESSNTPQPISNLPIEDISTSNTPSSSRTTERLSPYPNSMRREPPKQPLRPVPHPSLDQKPNVSGIRQVPRIPAPPIRPAQKPPTFREPEKKNIESIRTSDGIFMKEKEAEPESEQKSQQEKSLAEILGQAKSKIETRRQSGDSHRTTEHSAENSNNLDSVDVEDFLPIEESAPKSKKEYAPKIQSSQEPKRRDAPPMPPPKALTPSDSEMLEIHKIFDAPAEQSHESYKKDKPAPRKETPEQILGISKQPDIHDSRNSSIKSEEIAAKPSPAVKSIIERSKTEAHTELEEDFDTGEKEGNSGPKLKLALVVVGFFLIITGAAGFVFINFLNNDNVQNPPIVDDPVDDSPVFVPAPEAILIVDAVEEVEIDSINYSEFRSAIDQIAQTGYPVQSIVHLPIMLTTGQSRRPITLSELFSLSQTPAPVALQNYEKFSLFMYFQNSNNEIECFNANILDVSCYGPRLGIAVDISSRPGAVLSEETSQVLTAMSSWEPTMVSNLSPLILTPLPLQVPSSFSTGNYKGNTTRFINLPIPTTSVDWVLYNEYLVLGTSMETARAAIDNLNFSFDPDRDPI